MALSFYDFMMRFKDDREFKPVIDLMHKKFTEAEMREFENDTYYQYQYHKWMSESQEAIKLLCPAQTGLITDPKLFPLIENFALIFHNFMDYQEEMGEDSRAMKNPSAKF